MTILPRKIAIIGCIVARYYTTGNTYPQCGVPGTSRLVVPGTSSGIPVPGVLVPGIFWLPLYMQLAWCTADSSSSLLFWWRRHLSNTHSRPFCNRHHCGFALVIYLTVSLWTIISSSLSSTHRRCNLSIEFNQIITYNTQSRPWSFTPHLSLSS